MLYIKETFPEQDTVALWVDGRLDRASLPSLKKTCLRHMRNRRKVHLHLEGLLYIDKEAKAFLREIHGEAILLNMPQFLKLEMESCGPGREARGLKDS